MLQLNDTPPEFELPDQDGKIHKLSDYSGKWLFLYFYPQDETFGCTTEACSVRDNNAVLKELGVEVLGISPDSVESHKKFEQNHQLNYPLLSDESKEVINQYGVWGEKSDNSIGVLRTSFLINPDGKITKVYMGVKPETHLEEVITDLKNQYIK